MVMYIILCTIAEKLCGDKLLRTGYFCMLIPFQPIVASQLEHLCEAHYYSLGLEEVMQLQKSPQDKGDSFADIELQVSAGDSDARSEM